MGIGYSLPPPNEIPKAERDAVLPDGVTLEGFAAGIQKGKFKNILVVAGAGMSVSAGIPDFRSPGTGLYHNLEKYHLSAPEDIFRIDFFKDEPRPFFHLAREMYPGTFRPTIAHHFIKLMENKGVLLRLYSQNIDTLERQAGISAAKLVEAHGSFASSTCRICGKQYPQEWMEKVIFGVEGLVAAKAAQRASEPKAGAADLDEVVVPRCEAAHCGGVVKPDITFFGESLPERYAQLVKPDTEAADAVIVIGTSLKVAPVSNIPSMVSHMIPRILVNREAVNVCRISEDTTSSSAEKSEEEESDGENWQAAFNKNTGFRFFLKDNYRDILLQEDADVGVQRLAEALGWEKELEALCLAGGLPPLPSINSGCPTASPTASATTTPCKLTKRMEPTPSFSSRPVKSVSTSIARASPTAPASTSPSKLTKPHEQKSTPPSELAKSK